MDTLIRFHFGPWRVRGQIVRLGPAWAALARRHAAYEGRDLAATVRDRLGELTSAGILLAASLKFDGTLVLQIHGKGPVSLYVAECEADGSFRATLKLRQGARVPQDASLADLVNQDSGGRFAVTLVPGKRPGDQSAANALTQTYQGIVPFEGDTVAEVLERYMARSEQIPSRLWLAASEDAAFGLLLQRMPADGGHAAGTSGDVAANQAGHKAGNEPGDVPADAADDHAGAESADEAKARAAQALADEGWLRAVTLADTLTRSEMLEQSAATLLRRLFWDTPLVAFEEREPRFRCTCSREKVSAMLKMLGRDEIESIIADRGEVAVTCEFCSNDYRFGAAESAALFTTE